MSLIHRESSCALEGRSRKYENQAAIAAALIILKIFNDIILFQVVI